MDKNLNKMNEKINYKDELNLKYLLNLFLRNKKLIGVITFIVFFVANLYSFTAKRVWKGEFQIVLKNAATSNNFDPIIEQFLSSNSSLTTSNSLNNSNNINTEVAILKSPLILMPIFELVKTEKINKEGKANLTFKSWKKENLDIELEKKTSVLTISYKDYQKELILPVLDKITETYQKYSSRNKKRSQELTKNFLDDQIRKYSDKSSRSLKKVQEFAIQQDLNFVELPNQSIQLNEESDITPSFIIPNVAIEKVRVGAANSIREIDSKIKKIEERGNDMEKLQYLFLFENDENYRLTNKLRLIEEKIFEMRTKYTENDIALKKVIDSKNLTLKTIRNNALKYLRAKKMQLESKKEAASRPKGVLLRYKELLREAGRDEQTLVQIENQLRVHSLVSSQYSDPWELITKPTVLKDPISPNKLRLALLGLLGGGFLSLIAAYYKEYKSGLIYENYQLESFTDLSIIENLKIKKINDISKENNFLKELTNISKNKSISFLPVGDIKSFDKNEISKFLKKNLNPVNNFYFLKNNDELSVLEKSDINFLITAIGKVKFDEILSLKNRLNLLNVKLSGIILLE